MPPKKRLRTEPASLGKARKIATREMLRVHVNLEQDQRQAIKRSTTTLTTELERLDAEAQRLAALRSQLVSQINVNQALLAPIRILPHDVLSEIFFEVVSRYSTLSRNLGTPAIARVCREWRALAFGTPRLWTTLRVPYGGIWNTAIDQKIRSYLTRSRQRPLHVHVRGDMDDWYYDYVSDDAQQALEPGADFCPADNYAMRAIRLIGDLSAHRWKSLTLSGHFNVFERQKKFDLPLLESIVITAKASPRMVSAEPLTLQFLRNAPRIRKMTLDVRYPGFALPAWDSLKEATYLFRRCTRNEFMSVENQVMFQPQLETLSVLDNEGYSGPYTIIMLPFGMPNKMPYLTTVTVSGLGHLILTCLDAPQLRKLVVRFGYEEDGVGPLYSILRMPNKSSLRSLRALELICVELGEEAEMDIVYRSLASLPTLESLHVESSQRFDEPGSILRSDLLVWLTRNEASCSHLPQLTELFLYFGVNHFKGHETQLRKLLESRESGCRTEDGFLEPLTRFRTDVNNVLQIG